MHKPFPFLNRKMLMGVFACSFLFVFLSPGIAQTAKKYDAAFVENLKKEALTSVASKEKGVQEMVDMVFSFGELGFQEVETSKYLTGILEKNGFTIERGISGIPTAWMAKWGNGSPELH